MIGVGNQIAVIEEPELLTNRIPTPSYGDVYLAFERPQGSSAKQRHHVRLWQSKLLDNDGRPLWLGSASFDSQVEFSHYTGQITHHISADLDQERDTLLQSLAQAQQLTSLYQVTGVGATFLGYNGGGDQYFTDGELSVGILSLKNVVAAVPPSQSPNPVPVELKHRVWGWWRHFLQ